MLSRSRGCERGTLRNAVRCWRAAMLQTRHDAIDRDDALTDVLHPQETLLALDFSYVLMVKRTAAQKAAREKATAAAAEAAAARFAEENGPGPIPEYVVSNRSCSEYRT